MASHPTRVVPRKTEERTDRRSKKAVMPSEKGPLRNSRGKSKEAAKLNAGPTIQAEPFRGSNLARAFYDPSGYVLIDRVAERLRLSKSQFADTIGLAREALYRPERMRAQKTQARTTEMLEILGRVVDWAGGEQQALAWYRAEPIPAFGGRTAEALVKDGKAGAVRDYLDRVATGGFA